ncbi:PBPb domain-containing protein [Nitrospira tepida]|uniref:PBPb domain-containing protein n=2 Tax=Nitrospira tepida TaxID=2973512 RepID=A0AA86N0M3_9BACT|nr:PBPb domain-containing protein [Nitrospira tepida]
MIARIVLTASLLALTGCGLVYDAVQWIYPIAKDDLQRVCARKRLRVGISVEPFRPFVFPAVFTDEGLRITGMDVDLVRELASALERRCGREDPVIPTLHLVRVRDQFVELNENKLDLIVSAVTANVPLEQAAGIAYSIPYYDDGAIGGMARSRELAQSIRTRFGAPAQNGEGGTPASRAFEGLRVAVPELRSPYVYAKEYLERSELILCDSLPAAFESQNPPVDVILGKLPVLRYIVTRVRKDWHLIEWADGVPLRLMREQYAVAMAEENYRLRLFVNDTLFRLRESGRLEELRRKWHDDFYAYPRRAATEGLPFSVEDLPQHYDQGTCRWMTSR